jgi:hypothetical protein
LSIVTSTVETLVAIALGRPGGTRLVPVRLRPTAVPGHPPPTRLRCRRRDRVSQTASALAFSWSNSACVIVPESSNDFAEAIWSAAPAPFGEVSAPATVRM